jgi:ABC-type amino acid transport substrate-binding protein
MEVPTAVQHLTGALFWPEDALEPAGSAATVGVLLGQIWPRRAAQEQGAAYFEVRSYDQMIEMTRSGRLQGFMMAAEALEILRPRYDYLGGYKIKKVTDIPLHLAVKRRYAALVPALDDAIRKMLAGGQIEREFKAEDR